MTTTTTITTSTITSSITRYTTTKYNYDKTFGEPVGTKKPSKKNGVTNQKKQNDKTITQ